MENWTNAYVVIETEEDEKKWKEFLIEYFPNHYASKLLKKDLKTQRNSDGSAYVRRIAVGTDGFGLLSGMCLHYGKDHYFPVKDFEEFAKTDIYQQIVNNGPSLEVGEPKVIHISLK